MKTTHAYVVCAVLLLCVLLGFAPTGGTAVNNSRGAPAAPTSVTMDWQTLVPAAGLDDVDANPVTNFGSVPAFGSSSITLTDALAGGSLATNKDNRRIVELQGMGGSTLLFRVKYPAAVSPGTSVTIAVGGCGRGGDFWDRLLQVGTAARSVTITTKSTDMTDGTWKYTDVDVLTHAVDNKGCWCITAGVEATGFGSTAELQVKGI